MITERISDPSDDAQFTGVGSVVGVGVGLGVVGGVGVAGGPLNGGTDEKLGGIIETGGVSVKSSERRQWRDRGKRRRRRRVLDEDRQAGGRVDGAAGDRRLGRLRPRGHKQSDGTNGEEQTGQQHCPEGKQTLASTAVGLGLLGAPIGDTGAARGGS